jgi:hypothetical protein
MTHGLMVVDHFRTFRKRSFVFRLIGVVNNRSICPIVFHVFERLKDELWHTSAELWIDDEELSEQPDSLDGE